VHNKITVWELLGTHEKFRNFEILKILTCHWGPQDTPVAHHGGHAREELRELAFEHPHWESHENLDDGQRHCRTENHEGDSILLFRFALHRQVLVPVRTEWLFVCGK